VRILFAFVGGNGHFEPMVPVAQACVAAGHTVTVVGRRSMAELVEQAGFRFVSTGAAHEDPAGRTPLLPLDAQREDRDLREGFARRIARDRAERMLALCADWKADLVVCDEVDFGSVVAAERLGLPYATVLVTAAGSFIRPEVIAEPLHELRAEHGLPADPDLAMLSRYLVLSPVPASYRDPAFPAPATTHLFRPLVPVAPADPAPPWAGPDTVYFTLGTVFNTESGDLFNRVLTGLTDLPINLVVTVGHRIDPAEFGTQPAHVHIERYIPQAQVLPWCRAMVSHGGSGSVIGALAHGLPSVLVPMGADQPHNGDRCAAIGVARVLDPVAATPESVREAAAAVLADPGYRLAAQRVRDEIAAMPAPEYTVGLLERLATEKQPLVVT
jgi:UDP:flavonoid glycosyltransferase YjiC (YdhE family)